MLLSVDHWMWDQKVARLGGQNIFKIGRLQYFFFKIGWLQYFYNIFKIGWLQYFHLLHSSLSQKSSSVFPSKETTWCIRITHLYKYWDQKYWNTKIWKSKKTELVAKPGQRCKHHWPQSLPPILQTLSHFSANKIISVKEAKTLDSEKWWYPEKSYVDKESKLVKGKLLLSRQDIVTQLDQRVVVAPHHLLHLE